MLHRGLKTINKYVTSQIGKSKKNKNAACPMTMRHLSSSGQAKYISIEEAKQMPKLHRSMPNDILVILASTSDHEAREERVIREIMATDNLEWEQAYPKFVKIVNSNRRGTFYATLPHKTG